MIIGEDILKLNWELTQSNKDNNYFNSYRARIAAKEQLEVDIKRLVPKYGIEDTAVILGISINRVKA